VREDNGAGQLVLGDLDPNGKRMGTPVDIISTQEHNLLPTQRSIMREQHDSLIAKGAFREYRGQDGFPLSLVRNPGNREGSRDKTPLSATNAFSHWIEGVMSVTEPDTPTVKAAQGTDTSPNGRRRESGPGCVGNLAPVRFLPSPWFCLSLPQPIEVISNPALISLQKLWKRGIWEG
jgi:hypothetical protein